MFITESNRAKVTRLREEHCLHQKAFYPYFDHETFAFMLQFNNLTKKCRFNTMKKQGWNTFHTFLSSFVYYEEQNT